MRKRLVGSGLEAGLKTPKGEGLGGEAAIKLMTPGPNPVPGRGGQCVWGEESTPAGV